MGKRKCPMYGSSVLYLDCLECEEKLCKRTKQSNKIVIGIDQSYADSGIAIVLNGQIKAVTNIYLSNAKSNTEKRTIVYNRLKTIFKAMSEKGSQLSNCEVICIIERIRLQSAKPGTQHFLNLDYIKGIGALNALIVDTASQFNIPVYSVDTRSWKVQVTGSSKAQTNPYGIPSEKWPTILWCIEHGYEKYIVEHPSPKKRKGVIERNGERVTYNDNKADALCIALYGFAKNQKLEQEH